MEVNISRQNTKMGHVASVSLVPIKDCANCVHCAKECYALRIYNLRKYVKSSWNHNSEMIHTNINEYMEFIDKWIKLYRVPLFRWHVGGDIINQKHLDLIIKTAESNKETKFLAFTKRFDLKYKKNLPENLSIVFSMFPKMELPKQKRFPIAWMQDGTENRIPQSAIKCNGNCETCRHCFDLKPNQHVYFIKH